MFYRLIAWFRVFPEVSLPIMAQVETVWERANQAADKFATGNDSMRFAMTLVALMVVIGFLAYLYIDKMRKDACKAENRINDLEKEIRDVHREHQETYDELRDQCDKMLQGYWGTMQVALSELAQNNRWLQGQGFVPPRHENPPSLPAPPQQQSQRPANFLPAGPRRIRRRFGGSGAREDQSEENQ